MIAWRSLSDPPDLFAWDADRAGGVTDDQGLAVKHVNEVLADARDGAHGLVRRVQLGGATGVRYVTLGVVGMARRDAETGAVEWTDGGPC